MFKGLVKLFVKDCENTKSPVVRERYGILSGITGIIVNVILAAAKFFIGTLSNSIAITGDALNNLSDAGSNVVTLVGFKMAGAKPDKEHPFGHGRIEYVAALIVGFIVELMGVELIKTSVEKIKEPEPSVLSAAAVIVLLLSMAGKIWLALFNRYLGKRIDSPAMTAVVADSISDTAATASTLLALILSRFTTLPVDGIFGIVVALFIMYSGYGILKESIGIILGTPPSKELVDELKKFILNHDGIIGMHDLVIHSYGATRTFASVHVEVPSTIDILKAHDTTDLIEREVQKKFGIALVVHLDPLVVNDERVNELRSLVTEYCREIDPSLSIHDFRVVDGPTHTNLIFDLVVPFGFKYSAKQVKEILIEKIQSENENYYAVITAESSYI
ncbi:MAG: cation diffusion facilitator family transporter [Clostridia bacterium]|nr:cation diffusion facilitator family transporter [Clostridia bacterium]